MPCDYRSGGKIKTVSFVGVVCLTGLVACSKTDTPQVNSFTAKVEIDLATPDKALKSYWAVRDSIRANEREVFTHTVQEKLRAAAGQLNAVSEGSLAKDFGYEAGVLETFSRDILDVKVESESRSVVTAVIKNTTPIAAGAEIGKFEEEHRRDGERYKYVLEKNQAGWRVAEIWAWDTYPTKDWKKLLPRSNKPSVPSLTFNGY